MNEEIRERAAALYATITHEVGRGGSEAQIKLIEEALREPWAKYQAELERAAYYNQACAAAYSTLRALRDMVDEFMLKSKP